MRSSIVRSLIVGALALSGAACHTIQRLRLDEVQTLRPPRVWVTLDDKNRVEVSGPQVYGDTLVGYVEGEFQEIPSQDMQHITIKRTNKTKTIALFAAGTVAVGGIVWMVAGKEGHVDPRHFVDCDDDPLLPECQ